VVRRGVASVLVVLVLGTAGAGGEPSAPGLDRLALAWLDLLDVEGRRHGHLPFDHPERLRWGYQPGPRAGVPLGEMDTRQRQAVHDLLQAALSREGYRTLSGVFLLEGLLRDALPVEVRRRNPSWRDPGLYHFAVFGRPGDPSGWAWRLEGHHISLHATCRGDAVVSAAPFFLGADPAHVRSGPHRGRRVLAAQAEAAHALAASLWGEQVRQGRPPDPPAGEIVLRPGTPPTALPPRGVPASLLEPSQRALLDRLLASYAGLWAEGTASLLLGAARAEPDRVRFLWLGGMDADRDHYFRVDAPDFVIEWDQHGNHVHTVWRGKRDEFGVGP
jgi:hypothetical protein